MKKVSVKMPKVSALFRKFYRGNGGSGKTEWFLIGVWLFASGMGALSAQDPAGTPATPPAATTTTNSTTTANPPAPANPAPTTAKPSAGSSSTTPSSATTVPPASSSLDTVVVKDIPVNSSTLPDRPADSVFGLGDSVLNTPRSVYQVSQDQLQHDPINQSSDLARYSPSITNSAGQGISGVPYIRGYAAEVYQDGFRVGRNSQPWDPNNTVYQSLDIVTGPASVIYGPSYNTGGYLDWTTKTPYFDGNHTQIQLTLGTWASGQGGYDNFEQTIDNSGPLTKDLAYRVVYSQSEADSYYIGGKNDFSHFYGALTWNATKNITVDWKVEYGDYDYSLVRGWQRVTQSLIDNGTYLSGTATPILKSGATYYEPVANSPTAGNQGFYKVTPNANYSQYTNTGVLAYAPGANPTGSIVGFVLRPGNVTPTTIYPYQGAVNPGDPISLDHVTAEQIVNITVDPETQVFNKSYYEHDDYTQQTYVAASLQGTIGDIFENRTEAHFDNTYKIADVDLEHKSNSGFDFRWINETVDFNNSNFLLNPYDISGNQSVNMNINNLYGILPSATNPPGTIKGVTPTYSYGNLQLTPIYPISGLPSPLGAGSYGSSGYNSEVYQFGLYSDHELIINDQWALNAGVRGTATYVNDTDPLQIPAGGNLPAATVQTNSSIWGIEPVLTGSLSYKPVPWTTTYVTYNYTQALNDDSGNSLGGIAPTTGGNISASALHSDSVLYETGAKFEFIPHQLFGSVAAYIQERQLAPSIVANSNPLYPKVRAHGFESTLNYQPVKNFSVGINYSWLEAHYENYNPNAGFSSPYGVVANGTTVFSATGSSTNALFPAGNYELSEPRNRVDVFADYKFDWGLGFRGDLWATTNYEITNGYANIPAEYDVDLGVYYDKPNWRVQVDFLNVTNQTNFEIDNSAAGENLLPSQPFAVQGKLIVKF